MLIRTSLKGRNEETFTLLKEEGTGEQAIELLQHIFTITPELNYLNAGTRGLSVFRLFADRHPQRCAPQRQGRELGRPAKKLQRMKIGAS